MTKNKSLTEIIMFDITDSKNSIKSSEFVEIDVRLEKIVTDINTAITSIYTIINNFLINDTEGIKDIKDKLRTLENRVYNLENK